MNRKTRLAIAIAITITVATVTGCTASREESCTEFGTSLSTASVGAVNAFARLDANPSATLTELETVRVEFDRSAEGWNSDVHSAAVEFSDALEQLTDATMAASEDGTVDADAVHSAVTRFEGTVEGITVVCSPVPTPST